MYNKNSALVLVLVLAMVIVAPFALAPTTTHEPIGTAQFVLKSWDYTPGDEYGQGIVRFLVYENSTGSWVQVGGYYSTGEAIEWNVSLGIELFVECMLNSTLVNPIDEADGANYMRLNVTVTNNYGAMVFSQDNLTYWDWIANDGELWLYRYYAILNFLPVAGGIYTATVTYEVFSAAESEVENQTLWVDGQGYHTAITGTYADVDEQGEHDGDTSYLAGTFNEQRESVTLQNLAISGVVDSVTVYVIAKRTASSPEMIIFVRASSTDYDSSIINIVPYAYESYNTTWTENPDTSSSWTVGEINTLEVGIECVESSARFTQIYVVIEYRLQSWHNIGNAEIIFEVGWSVEMEWTLNSWYIMLGMLMVIGGPTYLAYAKKSNRLSLETVFIFLVVFIFGWAMIIGGVGP